MRWILGIIGILALAMAASWWWTIKDLRPLDDTARAKAPGQFVQLDAGMIHYRWIGPEDGDIIVMVHGFSTPNFIFEQNAAALAEAGHRLLVFDHFGRGWSDRPKATYDADFYDAELLGLLDSLNITEPVGIAGLSMGGVIVPEFAVRHPERVNRVALIVPAGLDTNGATGVTGALLKTPVVGDWLWSLMGPGYILSPYHEEDYPPENRLQGDLSEQLNYRGYLPALLSTFRHLQMGGNTELFERLEKTGFPVFAIYGTADETVNISSADKLADIIPSAVVVRVEGGDHGVNVNRNAEVSPHLVRFFEKTN